ncbi:hypothetical protein MHY1_00982 [Methylovirgula sp. HY1]|nr:hypothetical protein MHY1_00982 [Methylovirgula sp. HY1]
MSFAEGGKLDKRKWRLAASFGHALLTRCTDTASAGPSL